MSITIRSSNAVSNRKIVNRRLTRCLTSAESGPNCCAMRSIRAELRSDEQHADACCDCPSHQAEVDPEHTPAEVALLERRDPEDEHREQSRRVHLHADPRAKLAQCSKCLAVAFQLEHDAQRGQRDVAPDPDHGRRDVQRLVDVVGIRRVPQEHDRADEQHQHGEQRRPAPAWRFDHIRRDRGLHDLANVQQTDSHEQDGFAGRRPARPRSNRRPSVVDRRERDETRDGGVASIRHGGAAWSMKTQGAEHGRNRSLDTRRRFLAAAA